VSRRARIALACALLAAWLALAFPGAAGAPRAGSLARRVLGPVASLAASAQWVRVETALRAGELERALARAETALALDPGSPAGWAYLGAELAFTRASVTSEPDPLARRRWIEAGLATLERGERAVRAPDELAYVRALVLVHVHYLEDADEVWPGGADAALAEAARVLDRLAARGHAQARELAPAIERLRAERARGR
jgi:hypothetical protein